MALVHRGNAARLSGRGARLSVVASGYGRGTDRGDHCPAACPAAGRAPDSGGHAGPARAGYHGDSRASGSLGGRFEAWRRRGGRAMLCAGGEHLFHTARCDARGCAPEHPAGRALRSSGRLSHLRPEHYAGKRQPRGSYFPQALADLDVTREAVRQSIRQAARYGRLDVYRISGLSITPVSDSRAVATFRKHWRISGRGRPAGEEGERMTLVRTEGAWRISSEQATR